MDIILNMSDLVINMDVHFVVLCGLVVVLVLVFFLLAGYVYGRYAEERSTNERERLLPRTITAPKRRSEYGLLGARAQGRGPAPKPEPLTLEPSMPSEARRETEAFSPAALRRLPCSPQRNSVRFGAQRSLRYNKEATIFSEAGRGTGANIDEDRADSP